MKQLIFSIILLLPVVSHSLDCNGKVQSILTASQYCESGKRVGFHWEGSTKWLCSSTQNMDAMLMAAFATGSTISVRDSSWTSCNDIAQGSKANLIWIKKED